MKAMILAAGEGTRLRPLTLTCPKPMVPVGNIPLLVRTLALLRDQGIEQVAVNLYHRANVIRAALGETLRYSDETTLLGTAGGVKRLEAFLNETFVVLYGDNLYDFPLAPIVAFHRQRGALATIATFTAENPSACGLVETGADGRVTRFREKPPPEEVFTDQASAGVYVLEPAVFAHIPADTVCDFGRDIFPALLEREPGALFATALNGYLRDTGTLPNYRQANWDALAMPGSSPIGPGASIASDAVLAGRFVIGAGCQVASGAVLADTILWENCRIGAKVELQEAILGRDVTINAGARVGRRAVLADGAVVAEDAFVPEDARIGPGERVR